MKTLAPFSHQQRDSQREWRKQHVSSPVWGSQNGTNHEHIIPKAEWLQTVWEGIRRDLEQYLIENKIHSHTGTHNLLSSWVLCANLYFPARLNPSMKRLMTEFLKQHVSSTIKEITCVELEFAFPAGDTLHPSLLLGEQDGNRGSGQTSPDVAFKVATETGVGIVLTECKYTEHSFYGCSARRTDTRGEKKGNPDPSRCLKGGTAYDYASICHQLSATWGRKYWQFLKLAPVARKKLNRCPAATAGYQLFRQQALANGIYQSGQYDLVASCVALDGGNTTLLNSLKSTGIADVQTEWGPLFDGSILFRTWTHRQWVEFVRANQTNGEHDSWLKYLNERYGY